MAQTYNKKLLKWRKFKNQLFKSLFALAIVITLLALVTLLAGIFSDGIKFLDWQFLTSWPSRFPEAAGIKSALAGTLAFISITAPLGLIIGVSTAIYLEEYVKKSRFTQIMNLNISNLAGVPSIVYGILGLVLFVRGIGLGRSVLSGALTMTLLILPVIITSAQEAIKAVPMSLRHASYALGATKTQTAFRIVLPVAVPGIMTGTILAISRAIGETAPLITIGALTYVAFLPNSLSSEFTVLPIQLFNWISRPQTEFHDIAAAGIIVLLIILLLMNSIAVFIREKFRKDID